MSEAACHSVRGEPRAKSVEGEGADFLRTDGRGQRKEGATQGLRTATRRCVVPTLPARSTAEQVSTKGVVVGAVVFTGGDIVNVTGRNPSTSSRALQPSSTYVERCWTHPPQTVDLQVPFDVPVKNTARISLRGAVKLRWALGMKG
jgi:hypothetical protein